MSASSAALRGRGSERKADDRTRQILERTGVQCRDIADRFEFPFFQFMFRTVVPPGTPLQVVVDGGPEQFREIQQDRSPGESCPVMRKALRALIPFQMRDVADPDDRKASALFRRYAQIGILDGFVVPLHGPRASHGMLMLMSSSPLPKSVHLREELFRHAHWLALFMFERTIDEISEEQERNPRRQLTARQRRALKLAASGKVLEEIAADLVVHPSTARYLLGRATEKLGVDSRAEAILRVAALSDFSQDLFAESMGAMSIYVDYAQKGRL